MNLTLLPVLSALSNQAVQKKPIKRVAIVGAGIAGLSLAHALENSKEDLEVSIFDSRKALDYTVGSGVQLNGGLSILGKINKSVQKSVMEAGVPISDIRGKNKSWFSDTSTDTLWNYSIEKLIRDAGGAAEEELIQDDKVLWCGITRGALQETLFETLPKNDQMTVEFDKALVGIESGASCKFADGSTRGPFDVIVGADGVKSAVKEYIERGEISKDPSKREGSAAAIYSGIRIGYAVQDGKSLEERKKKVAVEQTFADGAYIFSGTFGNGEKRPPCNCAFIISLDENYNGPFKRKTTPQNMAAAENSDWSQDNKMTTEEVRTQMLQRMEATRVANKNTVQTVSDADRFFDLGVYFHNPISLMGWSKEIPSSTGAFAVLCGDAAHAMPPFLGQGANQGIQDAFCLSRKIETYNSRVMTEDNLELKTLLKEYEKARWSPTASITAKAAILGYLETGGRNGFYSKFRDAFFKTLALLRIPVKVLLDAATPKVE